MCEAPALLPPGTGSPGDGGGSRRAATPARLMPTVSRIPPTTAGRKNRMAVFPRFMEPVAVPQVDSTRGGRLLHADVASDQGLGGRFRAVPVGREDQRAGGVGDPDADGIL